MLSEEENGGEAAGGDRTNVHAPNEYADNKSVSTQRATKGQVQDRESGAAVEPAETRRLHACLYIDTEKAEFGSS